MCGKINPAPPTNEPGQVDEVTIAPTRTDKLRIVCEHALPGKTGITELLVWQK